MKLDLEIRSVSKGHKTLNLEQTKPAAGPPTTSDAIVSFDKS